MDAMENKQTISSLQVAIDLPPENYDDVERVRSIVHTIFEGATYQVFIAVTKSDKLDVTVHIPMLSNDGETSWLKPDPVASALIKFRLGMIL